MKCCLKWIGLFFIAADGKRKMVGVHGEKKKKIATQQTFISCFWLQRSGYRKHFLPSPWLFHKHMKTWLLKNNSRYVWSAEEIKFVFSHRIFNSRWDENAKLNTSKCFERPIHTVIFRFSVYLLQTRYWKCSKTPKIARIIVTFDESKTFYII